MASMSNAGPGAIRFAEGSLTINVGKPSSTLVIVNTGDRPIQVGSHIHLAEVNSALEFDREAARGHHLDIPSGTSRRFEPGASREVGIVPFGGTATVPGIQIKEVR